MNYAPPTLILNDKTTMKQEITDEEKLRRINADRQDAGLAPIMMLAPPFMPRGGTIDLKCWKCGAEKPGQPRSKYDPPRAVLAECTCNDCEDGGEFSQITYFDGNGNEVPPTEEENIPAKP